MCGASAAVAATVGDDEDDEDGDDDEYNIIIIVFFFSRPFRFFPSSTVQYVIILYCTRDTQLRGTAKRISFYTRRPARTIRGVKMFFSNF